MEVYDAVIDRFGADRVSCISMMDTYRVRHAIRDVGAALGLPVAEVDAVAKAFPHIRANQVHAALCATCRSCGPAGWARDAAAARAISICSSTSSPGSTACPGTSRCTLRGAALRCHAARPHTRSRAATSGYPMSQFDKDDVEELGLLKLDLLGIRMQSAIAHALDEVAAGRRREVDIDAVPRDDPTTFELIQQHPHARACSRSSRPVSASWSASSGRSTFEDLVIDISLFRPGPVKSDMVTPFLMARNGWREPVYPHPDLEFALEQTAGVVVFHEQVLQIVARMTGCTLAEADEVRRALGEKDAHPEVRAWFMPRVARRGLLGGGRRAGVGGAGRLRLVRLLQGARGRLRAAHLPVGVAEDPPHGGLPRRGAHPRPRHVPEAADPRRRPQLRRPRARPRRQRLGRHLPGRAAGRRRGRG